MKTLSLPKSFGRRAHVCASMLVVTTAIATVPSALAADGQNFTLAQAISLAADAHPRLKAYQYRDRALEYSGQTAALKPGYRLAFELENFAGTGEAQALSGAEATLSLTSAFESPAKRRARLATVGARRSELEAAERIAALEIAAEVAERFMQVVIYRERLRVARDEARLADEMVATVRKRANAGAAPQAELRRARASRAKARLEVSQLQSQMQAAKALLALMWRGEPSSVGTISTKLFSDLQPGDLDSLVVSLNSSPEVLLYAAQERLAESIERQLESQNRADIEWSVGARRLQGSQDIALVGGVSMPLNTARRNSAAINAAVTDRQRVAIDRDVALLDLKLQLQSEYQRRVVALNTLSVLRSEVIPELRAALEETRSAYLRGRYSYLDLIAVRAELLTAREDAVEAAAEAQLARLQLEALTGEPLLSVNGREYSGAGQ